MCWQKSQEQCILYSLFIFIMCEICDKEYPNETEKELGYCYLGEIMACNIMPVLF
jgi:hypothetical protein